ncbi:MAG TPA: hypothetical protein VFH97_04135 [Gemmatimonadales bacterium]|nr:hypothetical protein [Gemmatimonadales bacterium]
MADPSRTAARTLHLLLPVAILALAAGVAFPGSPLTARVRQVGLWTLALTPFAVLLIVSAGARRARWFAVGTIALVLIGFFLAR